MRLTLILLILLVAAPAMAWETATVMRANGAPFGLHEPEASYLDEFAVGYRAIPTDAELCYFRATVGVSSGTANYLGPGPQRSDVSASYVNWLDTTAGTFYTRVELNPGPGFNGWPSDAWVGTSRWRKLGGVTGGDPDALFQNFDDDGYPYFRAPIIAWVQPNGSCGPQLEAEASFGVRVTHTIGCDDGSDNDGDGKTDWPLDPGCGSLLDQTEGSESCGLLGIEALLPLLVWRRRR